ncbi:30S ribosomal protein S20 [Fusobacterium sp.]|uniref:30S ribosomal protein S20 n=1 Tax=Fusobacterium sp. TaxID=68766 RepID=UPI002639725B|nr:30S ribosomal protein S20 [Fusobacterium sp.]
MANNKSAKKRVELNERNRVRNQAVKTRVKNAAKRVLAAVEANDKALALEVLSAAYKEFDKAVSKGVAKKNTISRKKSRLAARVNAL